MRATLTDAGLILGDLSKANDELQAPHGTESSTSDSRVESRSLLGKQPIDASYEADDAFLDKTRVQIRYGSGLE